MKSAMPLLPAALLVAGCTTGTQSAAPEPGVELLDTYWRPVEIDGKPLIIHAGTREPHIMLKREGVRVTGFTGCNTIAGSFQQAGDVLRFGKLITTRMACVGEAGNALEAEFTKALDVTASYRIAGDTLELRDAAGSVRMRFTARPQQ